MSRNFTGKIALKSYDMNDNDENEEMELLLSSETNWDHFLTPAPLAISLLGELMIISNKKDFSLKDNTPEGGFKYLRHPTSFRACLVQVSNEGWSAFNQAHTNMDQIRLYSAKVEGHVKNAVELLFGGSREEIRLVLPKCLGRVSSIADSCKELATSIETKFTQVMQVTAELSEVCTAAQGLHESRYKETVKAIENAKKDKEIIEASRQQMEKRCKTLEEDVKEANTALNLAMKDIPSSAKIFGMSIGEQFLGSTAEIVKLGVTNFLPGTFNKIGSCFSQLSQVCATYVQNKNTSRVSGKEAMDQKGSESKIQKITNELIEIASSGEHNGKPYPSKEKLNLDKVKDMQKELEREQLSMPRHKSSKEKAIHVVCEKGIKICKQLESTSLFENDSKGKKGKEIAEKALKLKGKSRNLEAENMVDGSKSDRGMSFKEPENQQKSISVVKSIIDCAKFKAEMKQQIRRETMEAQEKALNDFQKKNEDLQKVIRELADLDPRKVDFETIQATLVKGIKAFTEIRQQWTKLVDFFQMISNIIKCNLDISLKSFVEYAATATEEQLIESTHISDHLKHLIIDQANEANKVALAVHSISNTYVKVSRMHLMDRITRLGKLITLDPNDPSAQAVRDQLHTDTEKAQRDISMLVSQHQKTLCMNARKMLQKSV